MLKKKQKIYLKNGNSWIVRTIQNNKLSKLVIKISKALGNTGTINIQLKKKNKNFLPIEINSRFSGTTCIRAALGFNEPEMYIKSFYLNKSLNNIKIKKGFVFRYIEEIFVNTDNSRKLKNNFSEGKIIKWFQNQIVFFMNNKIFWCKSCVIMSTRPRVTFDKKGKCSACQWTEEKKNLDWKSRQKKLDLLLAEQKSNKYFQCVTAVSGGKDGSYITYNLKHKKKVNPLAVTVRPPIEQDIGKKNIINFVRSGYQHIHVTPDEEAMRKLNKLGFTELGHPYYGWLISVHTAVLRIAFEFDIKLIFYSEDGDVEYGGDKKHKDKGIYGMEYQLSNYIEGDYQKIINMERKPLFLPSI